MEIISIKVSGGNFGDDLNDYLWQDLIPNLKDINSEDVILGIGSLQGVQIPKTIKRVHVLGAGANNLNPSKWLGSSKFLFHFVRGPLTAKKWGCEDKGIVDGAILILNSKLKDAPLVATRKIGYSPHHVSDERADWSLIADMVGVEYISTRNLSVPEFISKVKSCDYIVTEALHGAIVADLYRKPWIPVASDHYITEFKWNDFCQSLGLVYSPFKISSICTRGISLQTRVENFYKRGLIKINIGKTRWKHKKFLLDHKSKNLDIVSELNSIINTQQWVLSNQNNFERVSNAAFDAFYKFKTITLSN